MITGFLMKQLFFLLLCFFCITFFAFPQSPSESLWLKYGERELKCLVFPPPDSSLATGLILVHEEWGLTDWVKSISGQIAAEGYLVIVPDLLSGHKAEKDLLPDFVNEDVIRTALLSVDREQIMSDLDESYKYLKTQGSFNGKIAIIGFSWGGTQAFLYLARNPGLSAGYIFYGISPKNKKELSGIQSPVFGFYGEYDSRVNSSIEDTERKMHKLGKVFQPYIIHGGGHGFMRSGERLGATEDNIKARTAGWNKLMELLAGI
jgi:carboxymethylenebutenolidase